MFKLFAALRKERLWDFKGGIHPPEMKQISSEIPLRRIPLPNLLIIPLQQHLGPEGDLLVKVGERVLKGQPLTRGNGRTLPVHASTSGTISAISRQVTAHPSGLPELCISLVPDQQERWGERHPLPDYRALTPPALIDHIHQAGIAGLGGAGFPTAAKLNGGADRIHTLIINAAECEPYITADDRLMREHAADIVTGCAILSHILSPERVLIGIEDNKPQAIAALRQALQGHEQIQLRVIPTKYPSGGAKQLIKILTGMEVPHGQHSASIGVLMQNVATVYAIKRAVIDGEPLIERVVTLTGEQMHRPGNVWAAIGTPVKHLLQNGGFIAQNKHPMVIMGGPLMGFTLSRLGVPVVKITNCILTPSRDEFSAPQAEQPCIRCGACADVCPARLLPQQLYWYSQGKEHDKARDYHLQECIECGACAYVCPSNIPLVQYYRQEKAEIRALDDEARRAAEAKARFEARLARLAREKAAREQRHKQAAVSVSSSDREAIQAALQRINLRKAGPTDDSDAAVDAAAVNDPRQAALAAAIARAKAKQAAASETDAPNTAPPAADNTPDDPRKAAIARAKAKQAAASETDAPNTAPPAADNTQDDPRKAAIAAAIARAKAKQAATSETDAPNPAPPTADKAPDDPRKAAIAAAIARAKAKQAAASETDAPNPVPPAADKGESPRRQISRATLQAAYAPGSDADTPAASERETPASDRQAAIATAIARVKARQALVNGEAPQPTAPSTPTDAQKAAVAAAIARIKAKQASAAPSEE
ncbi:electron transport complex protein [Edwardsiella piscicida]|uniref:Ion-translocating oxidoreductase complex subunit C n=2 Tax=Edwardsiella piscicida TaxID=1263550 RepID=A0AAU8PEI2_EDWPI|nr:electron transport complex subunit RsxC [Edwardsiella piscicida]ACY84537.1 electron transport complex protein [Edwardsiella tarda EIB202]ARD19960.1 electron transport complex subunit RsxC [Edwardsiella piscicida]MDM3863325.1 electron transport complex subunit RsxC [Edwardsiella piscicida]UJT84047.1 electron transport complex subunit RsxC [Edwardsiella piscicida]UJT87319.1 electron transport complex subunit RsxC [Edwardsiella piscicida]